MKVDKYKEVEKIKKEKEKKAKEAEPVAVKITEQFPGFTVEELRLMFPHIPFPDNP